MRIVVIGAGASGLCSALILARYGHKVTLLEAGSAIAPLLRGFSRAGLHFDTGFHKAGALDKNGALRRYLRFMGLDGDLELTPLREDCCELFRFVNPECPQEADDFSIPQGVRSAAEALAAHWPDHAKLIRQFFRDIENTYFYSPFINPGRLNANTLLIPERQAFSVYWADLLKRCGGTNEPPTRLKTLLAGRAIYYGTPPERAAFEEMALVTYSMLDGVHSMKGGGAALADAFELALSKVGVKVRLNCAATSLRTEPTSGKRSAVCAVLTEHGEEIPCQACLYSGHPTRLPAMLPENALRPSMRQHLLSLEETHKVFMLFGVSHSDFLVGRDLTLCMSDDLDEAHSATGDAAWLHIACGTPDATGRHPLFIAVMPTPDLWSDAGVPSVRPPDYRARKADFAEKIGAVVRRLVPELADLKIVESASEYTLRDWVYGCSGSIYGVLHSADNFPVLPFTHIQDFYLTGQNVILPGLLGAFVSAAVACGAIVGYHKLFKDLA